MKPLLAPLLLEQEMVPAIAPDHQPPPPRPLHTFLRPTVGLQFRHSLPTLGGSPPEEKPSGRVSRAHPPFEDGDDKKS